MVNLETQKSIIKLGEQLVKELKLDPHGDTISRWMAHYIAEQITIAKQSTGLKKRNAEKNCFEAILKLWESRSYFPNGKRPFEKFEVIGEALEKISPNNSAPYYYTEYNNSKPKRNKKLKSLLDIAKVIDEVARVWLEQVFEEAIKNSSNKGIKIYLKNALHFKPNNDTMTIVKFLDEGENIDDQNEKLKRKKIENIRSRIDQLEEFFEYSEALKTNFEIELNKIEDSQV